MRGYTTWCGRGVLILCHQIIGAYSDRLRDGRTPLPTKAPGGLWEIPMSSSRTADVTMMLNSIEWMVDIRNVAGMKFRIRIGYGHRNNFYTAYGYGYGIISETPISFG